MSDTQSTANKDPDIFVPIDTYNKVITDGGNLAYLGMSAEGELWPCLLEKAMAKLFTGEADKRYGGKKGYKRLESNHSNTAFKALTGAKDEQLININRRRGGGDEW